MSDENQVAVVPFEPALPISRDDLHRAHESRALLKQFIKAQMIENVDYGVIPGTQKQSLFQPGAQKLANLFGLGVRIVSKDKEVDIHQNFAMFSYLVECYHLRTNKILSQCEGSCNSHERKYRYRRHNGALEETSIGDVMNTLMKMAQKRAYVGAVISATGASDFYTQDIEDAEDLKAIGGEKPSVKKAAVKIEVKSAKSFTENGNPIHCGKPMMTSKINPKTWYCMECKTSIPKTADEVKL